MGSTPRRSHPHRRTRSLNRNTSCKRSFPPSKIRQLLPSFLPLRTLARRSGYSGRGLIPPVARISPSATWERGWGGERGNARVAVLQKLRVCCRLWPFGASLMGVCRQEKKNIWEASSMRCFESHLFTASIRASNISSLLKSGHNKSRSAHLCQGCIGNLPGALGPCLICISFTQMSIKINALRHNICLHLSLLDRQTATAPGEPRPPHPPPHAQLHRPHAALGVLPG